MKSQFSRILILLVGILMALGVTYPGKAAPPAQEPPPKDLSSVEPLIRLQFATFNPLAGEPGLPEHLALTGYAVAEAGPYLVQFEGPVQEGWKEAVVAAGGQIDGYVPDFTLIVRLNNSSRAQVEALDFVRWVGIYQPAYKLPAQLSPSPLNLYRVRLANWADFERMRGRLLALGYGVSSDGKSLVINARFDQLPQIARLPDVLWIEEFQFFEKYNNIATGIMNAATPWSNGYTGNGQLVTIADTGLDKGVDNPSITDDIHRDFDNRVAQISSWPVVPFPGCIANGGANDGAADKASGHGTHVAGSVGGNGARSGGLYKGPAYQATLTFQAVEQFTTFTASCGGSAANGYYLTGIPNDLNNLFQESYNWGSRIHTNSWGTSVAGQYTTSSQQADEFTWSHKNFTILFAAGNAGRDSNSNGYVDEDSLGSPATAKNVITIGASENNRSSGGYNPGGPCSTYGNCFGFPANPTSSDRLSDDPGEMAAFSSRGPTDDGRIKPDLVAPGTNILSTRSISATGAGWGAFNSYYMYNGGTSMATPLAAGGATVVRDYLVDGKGYTNPSAALIKAILINSAVDISGYGNTSQEAGQRIPNNHEGWGRIDLAAATNATNRTFVDDQSLTTGVTHSYVFTATSSAVPFKTSLVWTDYPGNPAGSIQLVNNLNLKVTAPNGTTTYYGNKFNNGWSTTGGSFDTVNNVENVYLQSPTTGKWTIDVSGANVPQGPQPYALVVYGQGTLSGPGASPGSGANSVYLPLIIKSSGSGSAAITPGFWQSTNTAHEFYVTPNSSNVDNYAIYITVTGCGNFKITRTVLEPITNGQFSFSGSFYASGTFDSATTASGMDGLNNFFISSCGLFVSGGPWSWNANWQNSSQPTFLPATVTKSEIVEIRDKTGESVTTVMPDEQ